MPFQPVCDFEWTTETIRDGTGYLDAEDFLKSHHSHDDIETVLRLERHTGVIYVALFAGAGCIPFAGVPGCCGAYFDAHLACSALAWKTPSGPILPSARACDSSLNVSGGASVPV